MSFKTIYLHNLITIYYIQYDFNLQPGHYSTQFYLKLTGHYISIIAVDPDINSIGFPRPVVLKKENNYYNYNHRKALHSNNRFVLPHIL